MALLLAAGCGTPMTATRLSQPVAVQAGAVQLQVREVHLDRRLRVEDFSRDSRVLVPLSLVSSQPVRVSLRKLYLSMTDAFGERVTAAPLAMGLGEPPERLHDGDFVGPVSVEAGRPVRAWVAFGELPPRRHPELAEYVALHVPAGAVSTHRAPEPEPEPEPRPEQESESDVELVLSEPGDPPVWHGDPVTVSSGMGAHFQAFPDEGAFNFILNTTHYAIGPTVLATSFGIGARTRCEPDPSDALCENLAARIQLGLPLWRGRVGAMSPFLGGELALGPADRNARFDTLVGPSLGVDVMFRPLQPRHGPFPVHYQRSMLGEMHMNLGLVWWFGDDVAPEGAPGASFTLTHAHGW
ncbi:MAG: hypothetical protein PVI30_25445 [Myxococcales bacterium]